MMRLYIVRWLSDGLCHFFAPYQLVAPARVRVMWNPLGGVQEL